MLGRRLLPSFVRVAATLSASMLWSLMICCDIACFFLCKSAAAATLRLVLWANCVLLARWSSLAP